MKKLIIVCEEKYKIHADFLSQLVSLQDDTGENVRGVKDGEVAALVWTEKEYEANAPQISSEQYIVFIGNSKLIKAKRTHMLKKWDKFGMNYGWLGKQAVLFVEEVVDIKEYNSFIEFAKSNNENVEKKIELLPTKDFKEDAEDNNNNKSNIFLSSMKKVTNFYANVATVGVNKFNELSKKKDIENQEYTCLVLEFYLNALSKFLNLEEE